MKNFKYVTLLLIISILAVGCSKESKDEANELAKQLSGDSTRVMDSLAQVQRTADSIATAAAEEQKAMIAQQQAEAEANKMPKRPAGEGYTVQVAGCEDRDYAMYLVDKYTERGYEPFVTSVTIDGQGFYRVRIGIFASLSDAKALEAELKDKYSVDAWIDVTTNNY